MDNLNDPTAKILEIEARQDEALRQLAELERQLEQVLAQYTPPAGPAPLVSLPASPPAVKAA